MDIDTLQIRANAPSALHFTSIFEPDYVFTYYLNQQVPLYARNNIQLGFLPW